MTKNEQSPEREEIIIENKNNKEWTFKEFVVFIFLTFLIVLPIRVFIAQPFIVSGESMDPTFETGQYLIVDQLTYRLDEPERGDVVVFKLPQNKKKFLIKRMIGLPGETVKIEGHDVYIKKVGATDFIKIEEDYIEFERSTRLEETLDDDEYFVLGDNRANSLDSSAFGPVDRKFLVGRAFLRLFPVTKIGFMPGKENL